MRIIKRYSRNRKLYDKEEGKYVTLSEIQDMINNGNIVKVVEYKTEKDVTYDVLVNVLSNKLTKSVDKNTDQLINLINN